MDTTPAIRANHRRLRSLLAGIVALGATAGFAGAPPEAGAAASCSVPGAAKVGDYVKAPHAVFARNPGGGATTIDGVLTLFFSDGSSRCRVAVRAGSGTVQNECTVGKGWLPKGEYTMSNPQWAKNHGVIRGFAIGVTMKGHSPLAAKGANCSSGRTALYLHSEMNSDGDYANDTGPEQPETIQRWGGDYDYKSLGCIKVSPADASKLRDAFEKQWETNGKPAGATVATLIVRDGPTAA